MADGYTSTGLKRRVGEKKMEFVNSSESRKMDDGRRRIPAGSWRQIRMESAASNRAGPAK